jgi:hypothetical protein
VKLGESALGAELGQHRDRPLSQEDIGIGRIEDAPHDLCCVSASRSEDVLGPQGMAVTRVVAHQAKVDQRIDRAAKRFASDAEPALQLDEARPAPLSEEGEGGWSPPVVKQLDQLFG